MSRYKLLTPPEPIIQKKKFIIKPPSDGLIMIVGLIVAILYICIFLTKVPR